MDLDVPQRKVGKQKLQNYKLEVETLVQRSKELLGVCPPRVY